MVSNPAVVWLTESARPLAETLARGLDGEALRPEADTAEALRALFRAGRPIVALCAAGIIVRVLSTLLTDKHTEPPVVALAEDGSVAVPLLGGHHGANALARRIADLTGAVAAITTASDLRLHVALDEPPPGFSLANPEHAKAFAARLLAGEPVRIEGSAPWLDTLEHSDTASLAITVTPAEAQGAPDHLVYHPRTLALGVGCERGTDPHELITLVRDTLAAHHLSPQALAGVFSLDLKSDEPAVHALADHLRVPARFFTAARLNEESPRLANPSDVVLRETGCPGVAEGASLAAAGPQGDLIVPKTRSPRATCAIARSPVPLLRRDDLRSARPRESGGPEELAQDLQLTSSRLTRGPTGARSAPPMDARVKPEQGKVRQSPTYADLTRAREQAGSISSHQSIDLPGRPRGRLCVVGIGPGACEWLSPAAAAALSAATDWVGYGLYLDLVSHLSAGKTEHRFPLGAEETRVRKALALAGEGRTVALVSSGDAGIYAMGSLACELLDRGDLDPAATRAALEIIPGISAFQAAAARAGALIGHDFCCISLSDLLTPWEAIEARLHAAAQSDLVTALYNPRSARRTDQLTRAIAILAPHRTPETPVIVASNLGRPEERLRVVPLAAFDPADVDMLTIVLVGASQSRAFTRGDGTTIAYTPRGYAGKAST